MSPGQIIHFAAGLRIATCYVADPLADLDVEPEEDECVMADELTSFTSFIT